MAIYTKTGDSGTTSLIGGERVRKSDVRVEAYGTVDELTADLALLGDLLRRESDLTGYVRELEGACSQLMTVAAMLAVGRGGEGKVKQIGPEAVQALEGRIDAMTALVKPIANFTVPGGNYVVSLCHVCRTVCRRAERAALRASDAHPVPEQALVYLNRLSDYLYQLGRVLTEHFGVEEILWIP